MNSDFIQSALVKAVIMAGTWWATKNGMAVDGSTWQMIGAALFALGAGGLRLYQAYGQKKVPVDSVAIDVPPSHPASVAQVGDRVSNVAGKVVGCLLAAGLIALALGYASPAAAQAAPVAAPKIHHVVRHAAVPLPRPRAAGLEAYAAGAVATPAVKPGTLTTTAAETNPIQLLQKFSVDDLNAALADAQAQSPPDTTSINCYTALIPIVQSNIANPLPAGPGVFQLAQKVRDFKALTANLQSPTGPLASLNQACAAWVLDGVNTFIGLGAKVGLVAGTGGLGGALPALGGLGGGLLPFKLP